MFKHSVYPINLWFKLRGHIEILRRYIQRQSINYIRRGNLLDYLSSDLYTKLYFLLKLLHAINLIALYVELLTNFLANQHKRKRTRRGTMFTLSLTSLEPQAEMV